MDEDYCNNDLNSQSDDFNNETIDYLEDNCFSFPSFFDESSTNSENINEDEFKTLNQLSFYNSSEPSPNTNNKSDLSLRNSQLPDNNHRKRKCKRKSILSDKAQDLKKNYYLIFTNKKKFPKTIIPKIHGIMRRYLNLKPITRDVSRFKDKYFEEFANDSDKIIPFLLCNKLIILASIPELQYYYKSKI